MSVQGQGNIHEALTAVKACVRSAPQHRWPHSDKIRPVAGSCMSCLVI